MHYVHWIVFALVGLILLPGVQAAVSCNDIDISPNQVTLSEDQSSRSITLTLSNDSDQDFDIDNVRVSESDSRFDVEVISYDDQIEEDDTARVRLRYDTVDVTNDVETSFTLSVRGEFSGGKDCSFSQITFPIDVTIEDGENACTLLDIESGNVFLDEDETQSHFITIRNDADRDFEITDLDVFDDSTAFNASLKIRMTDSEFEKIVSKHSSRDYELTVRAFNVSEVVVDTVYIEVQGEFIGSGATNSCDNTEISASFEVEVSDNGTSGLCAEIKVAPTRLRVESQQTLSQHITISNTGEQHYYIDEFEVRDANYQVQFDATDVPERVDADGSEDVQVQAAGFLYPDNFDSNAFVYVKGHFSSGRACSVSGLRMPFTFLGNQNGTNTFVQANGAAPSTGVSGTTQFVGSVRILESQLQLNPRTQNELTFNLANDSSTSKVVRVTILAKPSNERYTNTVHLAPRDNVQVSFPSAVLRGQSHGVLLVEDEDALVSRPITLIATSNNTAQGTNSSAFISGIAGFVTGEGSIAIGLIVLVLLLIFLSARSAPPSSTWAKTSKAASGAPAVAARIDAPDFPEEVWMHPQKTQ